MTGEQLRAARALLGWSANRLADESGIGWATIQRLESKDGPLAGYAKTHDALRSTLEANGVRFVEAGDKAIGHGVTLVVVSAH